MSIGDQVAVSSAPSLPRGTVLAVSAYHALVRWEGYREPTAERLDRLVVLGPGAAGDHDAGARPSPASGGA